MWYTLTLVVGITLLFISIFKCRESLAFLKNSERTVGKVIDLEHIQGNDGPTYKAIFKFTTKANKDITFRQNSSSNPPSWRVDEEVMIAYDPQNPDQARVLSYFGVFSWSIVLMAIAMPAIVVGGGYHLASYVLK